MRSWFCVCRLPSLTTRLLSLSAWLIALTTRLLSLASWMIALTCRSVSLTTRLLVLTTRIRIMTCGLISLTSRLLSLTYRFSSTVWCCVTRCGVVVCNMDIIYVIFNIRFMDCTVDFSISGIFVYL